MYLIWTVLCKNVLTKIIANKLNFLNMLFENENKQWLFFKQFLTVSKF